MAIAGALKLNLQLLRDGEPAIGPGKAMVLDAIERCGSIAAAGRELGMSYRRIWVLADSLNRSWGEPVIATRAGRGDQGGTRLTPFGRRLLDAYREVEAAMLAAAESEALDWMIASLRPMD